MKKLNQEQLNEIIRKHGLWLENKEGGERADLIGADLMGADLRGADLRYADLRGADLIGADLMGADLRGADLIGADLMGADLRNAYLRNADLRNADLRYADLRYADLRGAYLRGAYLRNADLMGAVGDMVYLKTIILDVYSINYTHKYLQIGCKKFPIEDWWNFTDEEIREMDGQKAIDFWHKYKDFIKSAIELSPAASTE